MTDESTSTNYSGMFVPEADATPEVDPTWQCDGIQSGQRIVDIPEPTPDPEPVLDPEPIPDSPETFVSVNVASNGLLNLRTEASMDAGVVTTLANETALKVINADNPEWPFVEYANGDGEPLRGYVKGSLVVETPAQ